MKKILLACNAGMSTSMLVTKMRKAAEELAVEAEINALSITEAAGKAEEVDVILLGPQVRFQLDSVRTMVNGRIPVDVIDMRDYGTMNGKNVLQFALKLMEKGAN